MTSYWHVMLDLVQYLQLFQSNSINFVQSIKTRNILTITFNYINDVILSGITFQTYISIIDLILLQDSLNHIITHPMCINSPRDNNTTFILSFEVNLWWFFVQSDTKTLKLMLNNFFMLHRTCCIQNNHN